MIASRRVVDSPEVLPSHFHLQLDAFYYCTHGYKPTWPGVLSRPPGYFVQTLVHGSLYVLLSRRRFQHSSHHPLQQCHPSYLLEVCHSKLAEQRYIRGSSARKSSVYQLRELQSFVPHGKHETATAPLEYASQVPTHCSPPTISLQLEIPTT
uniref:Rho GTPase-activating protein 11B n=1 Tax=Lygus hesperus TaxID=30085 RepID=A0A0A9Z529_LYGHE